MQEYSRYEYLEVSACHSIAALPKRINANLERNAELVKQAKGLK